MRRLSTILAFSFLSLFFYDSAFTQTIYYVSTTGSATTCTSWETACTNPQSAIDLSTGNDIIVIAAGVYNASFTLFISQDKNGIQIYGGYAGNETLSVNDLKLDERDLVENETILDGQNQGRVMLLNGAFSRSTRIDGLTIQNGLTNSNTSFSPNGAGMVCIGATQATCSPSLSNLIFRDNQALGAGGGFGVANPTTSTSVSFENVTFINNRALTGTYNSATVTGRGGGLGIPVDLNTDLPPEFNGLTFIGNEAELGGGMYVRSTVGNLTITNSIFQGNEALRGGGLDISNNGSLNFTATLVNLLIIGNSASARAGGFYTGLVGTRLINSTISGNSSGDGGGMSADSFSGGPVSRVDNSIIWGNQAGLGPQVKPNFPGNLNFSHSTIEGTGSDNWDGDVGTDLGSNLASNPLFVAPVPAASAPFTEGDFRLLLTSPSLNSGDNTPFQPGGPAEAVLTDLFGQDRIQGDVISRGPYEAGILGEAIIHVNASATAGGNGLSWETALNSLEMAIPLATPQSIIVLAGGEYTSSNSAVLELPSVLNGIRIYGGYGGNESLSTDNLQLNRRDLNANASILDGEGQRRGVIILASSGRQISNDTVIDGLTIRNGFSTNGGGLFCDGTAGNCSPTLENIFFEQNQAPVDGGGIYLDARNVGISSPVIRNVSFIENSAGQRGGALYSDSRNFGESNPELDNSSFISNEAASSGGAVYLDARDNGTYQGIFNNVVFDGNTSTGGNGGAVLNNGQGGNASPVFVNTKFLNNSALNGFAGGAVYNIGSAGISSPQFIQVLASGNSANDGGFMYNEGIFEGVSNPVIAQSTIINNVATSGIGSFMYSIGLNGQAQPQVINSIIWNSGNSANEVLFNIQAQPRFSHSLVSFSNGSGIPWNSAYGQDLGGNIDADPLFAGTFDSETVNTDALKLTRQSPAIDGGSPEPFINDGVLVDLELDFEAAPRLFGRPDMGIFESGTKTIISGENTTSDWRFLANPVANTSFSDFFTDFWTQGIPGSDAPQGSPTIYRWDAENGEWSAPSSMNNQMSAGAGYISYIFDDQNYDGNPDGFPKPLGLNGREHTTEQSVIVFGNTQTNPDLTGWNLIGNPFGVPLSIPQVLDALVSPITFQRLNVNQNIYIWDPNKAQTEGENTEFGAYRVLSRNSGDPIPPFQSFFIRYTSSFDDSATIPLNKNTLAVPDQFSEDLYRLEITEQPKKFFQLRLEHEGFGDAFSIWSVPESGFSSSDYHMFSLQSLNPEYVRVFSPSVNGPVSGFALNPGDETSEVELIIETTHIGAHKLSWDGEVSANQLRDAGITEAILYHTKTGNEYSLFQPGTISFDWEPITSTQNKTGERSFDGGLSDEASKTRNPGLPMLTGTATESESPFVIIINKNTSTSTEPELAATFSLSQNYPNPFNPVTQISYELDEPSNVRLRVYDVTGRLVSTLVNEWQSPGTYTVPFNASSLASGVYVYRLEAGGRTLNRRMTLIK
ncbi:MAG: T9SS type A sorting domain-containing protein [Balneolales bacterium]|nr:T9SS type A sorting domain-containing protein [Balneolales bacterium]